MRICSHWEQPEWYRTDTGNVMMNCFRVTEFDNAVALKARIIQVDMDQCDGIEV